MDKLHQNIHIGKHLHLRKYLHNQFNDLLVSDTIRHIAISLISMFLPIYFLKSVYTIVDVIFYTLFQLIIGFFLFVLVIKNINKIGVKKSIMISFVINVVFYLILSGLNQFMIIGKYNLFFLLILLNSSMNAFYWSAHHLYFITSTKTKDEGKKLALILGIPIIFGIISPLIGGVIITYLSFQITYIFSAILLFISAIILKQSSELKVKKPKIKYIDILDLKNPFKNMIFIIHGALGLSVAFFWPILLFFLSLNLITIGLFSTISSSFYALFSYLSGRQIDKTKKSRSIMHVGSVGFSFSLFFRAIAQTIFSIGLFQTFGGVFKGILDVSIDTNFFKKAHKDIFNQILSRELYLLVGRVLLLLISLLLIKLIGVVISLIVVIFISGILTLYLNLIVKKGSFKLID